MLLPHRYKHSSFVKVASRVSTAAGPVGANAPVGAQRTARQEQFILHVTIPSSTARVGQRAEGWRDALTAAGRPVPEPLDGGWSPRSGYLAARAVVADPQVTAVLCGNDDLALGVLRAAREAGRDVPGDLSVMGFDDAPYAAYTHPTLTTVRLDLEGLGRGAFGMLHRLLKPENAPAAPLGAEPELIVRESTGPAPHRTA
ncbi:substrate-binding domain-containing protein [Streptomyces sp. DSM 15324]|uniref:substrate-binding domain-containing protein n=1 Tax=Streptomyces sp. DSM 15324 TaxID=1739111 RepID=UPI0022784A19|nr:substrate-binding domain-containing protein [Streptomyces sp. DSM 15324]